MMRLLLAWNRRGGRPVDLALSFADIMEVALALLSLTPAELEDLGWSFEDRKRLLDHLLRSGREAQEVSRSSLQKAHLKLRLPARDVRRLQHFVRRGLPKAASDAGVIERLGAALDAAFPPYS